MAQLLVIDRTTPYPDGSFGDDAFTAFGKINDNFAALQKAADMSSVSVANNQALYWNGTTWVAYTISAAARQMLAASDAAGMRTAMGAVGNGNNETIAGAKTFSGATVFTGSITQRTGTIGGVEIQSPGGNPGIVGRNGDPADVNNQYRHDIQFGAGHVLMRAGITKGSTAGSGGWRLDSNFYPLQPSAMDLGTDAFPWKRTFVNEIVMKGDAAAKAATLASLGAASKTELAALGARIPGKNIVINGDFRYWQRGTSFVGMSSAAYTADRFIPVMLGDTLDCIRAEHQPGDATNLFNARYFMRCSVNQVAGNGNLATLQYRIEDGVRLLAGKTVTVSMLVRASSATKMGMEFEMTFGTGGSPSPSIVGNSQLVTGISGGWQRISKTFTLADITGKTFGTNTEGYLSLILWLDAGSNWDARAAGVGRQSGDFQFSNIQIEVGSVATDFEQRNDAIELVLCQRYYEKSYNLSVAPGTATRVGCHASGLLTGYLLQYPVVRFSQRKRTSPAITLYNTADGAAGQLSENGGDGLHRVNHAALIDAVSSMSFEAFVQNGTAGVGNIARFQWTADAEI